MKLLDLNAAGVTAKCGEGGECGDVSGFQAAPAGIGSRPTIRGADMLILILGLILFLGIHSVRILAPGWREARLAGMGENAWKGTYSVVSFAGLILIVWGYSLAWATAPALYEPPVWMKHIAALLMLFALISLMISFAPTGRLKKALKHPTLLAVKIWALAHLLANGDLASILLFGSFLVWGVLARISVKRRGDNGPAVAGPVRNDVIGVAAGVALYLLFIWRLHLWLFGAVPLPVT